jgi:hypothetical protein
LNFKWHDYEMRRQERVLLSRLNAMGVTVPEYSSFEILSLWVTSNLHQLAPNDPQLSSTLEIAQDWLNQGHWNPTPLELLQSRGTPEIKTRLVALIREMNVRPVAKNPKLKELAEWVLKDLPSLAPDDPRTDTAVGLARAALNRMY